MPPAAAAAAAPSGRAASNVSWVTAAAADTTWTTPGTTFLGRPRLRGILLISGTADAGPGRAATVAAAIGIADDAVGNADDSPMTTRPRAGAKTLRRDETAPPPRTACRQRQTRQARMVAPRGSVKHHTNGIATSTSRQ
jgi:hypothetical protein